MSHVLVVDAGPSADENLRQVERHAKAVLVGTRDEGVAAATTASWTALIVAAELPGGSGFDVIDAARASRDGVPVLVVARAIDGPLVNRCTSLQAFVSVEPLTDETLGPFLRRAIELDRTSSERVATTLAAITAAAKLTAREASLLSLVVREASSKNLAAQHGVSPNTLKTQTRLLLRKLNAQNLDDVRWPILRTILGPKP